MSVNSRRDFSVKVGFEVLTAVSTKIAVFDDGGSKDL
jgi:hypothetical protein